MILRYSKGCAWWKQKQFAFKDDSGEVRLGLAN